MSKNKKPPKKKQRIGFFRILLLLIFLGSLTACGYLIYGEVQKEKGIESMEENIQTFVKSSVPVQATPAAKSIEDDTVEAVEYKELDEELDDTEDDSYTFDWDGLLAESKYVVGWIQIPGIERINYPIVQNPDDNQFFLTHDWKGEKQSAGAIFMNRYNTPDFTDMNTVIYGHRMKAGSMFGMLKYYEDKDFMDEHPYINIYTPDGQKLTYEVVCCSYVTDGSDAYMQHFNSPDERMAYYDMILNPYSKETGKGCLVKRDVELDRFDTTVMLSTCNKSGSGYYDRTIVLGKLTAIDLHGQPENWETE